MRWEWGEIQSAVAAFNSGPKGRHSIATPVRAWSRPSRSILRPEGPALDTMRSDQSFPGAAPAALIRLNKLLIHALTGVANCISALRASLLLAAF